MAYLNKIKILDQNGQVSGDSSFGFGIGMLREDGEGNIVYTGEGNKPITLLKKTKEGDSEFYTLVVPDGNTYTALTDYIDNKEKFLEKVEYKSSVEIDGVFQPALQFTFVVGAGKDKPIVNIPIKDLPIEADNIYFTEDFKVTTALGYFEPEASGYKNVEAKGKSVQSLFIKAFQKEDTALEGIEYPSATFTFGGTGAHEVGTKVTPTFQVSSFSSGSYPYGTEGERKTGIEPTGITASIGEASKTYSYTADKKNASDEIEIKDGYSQTISAYVSYGDATNSPLSNIGNEKDNKKILAGKTDTVTSASITGYRAWFYGGDHGTSINSSTIRNLTLSQEKNRLDFAAKDYAGCTRIIVAIPNNLNKTIKKVLLTSASNADITAEFKQQTKNVDVEGKNGYTAASYKVWVYSPAALDSTETYSITIG